MSRSRLGLLALGESPRRDVEETLSTVLGRTVPVIQAGALDGLAPGEREQLMAPGEKGIETSLADGTPIEVSKQRLVPLLRAAVRTRLASARAVVLLCSGAFPELRACCPEVLQPAGLVRDVVRASAGASVLGVLGPESDVPEMRASWGACATRVIPVACSPYGGADAVVAAAGEAVERGAELLLLDCIGFTEAQRRAVGGATGVPTLAPMSLVARLVPDLVPALDGSWHEHRARAAVACGSAPARGER